MKLLLYWMEGCSHCIKLKKELESNGITPDRTIERSSLTPLDLVSYGIRVYPTIVILERDGTIVSKMEGFQSAEKIRNAMHVLGTSAAIKKRFKNTR